MASTKDELQWCVKNTFIDMSDESDSDISPVVPLRSAPALFSNASRTVEWSELCPRTNRRVSFPLAPPPKGSNPVVKKANNDNQELMEKVLRLPYAASMASTQDELQWAVKNTFIDVSDDESDFEDFPAVQHLRSAPALLRNADDQDPKERAVILTDLDDVCKEQEPKTQIHTKDTMDTMQTMALVSVPLSRVDSSRSSQDELQWCVKNTFVDVFDESDCDYIGVGRFRSAPALRSEGDGKDSIGGAMIVSNVDDARKEQMPKTPSCVKETIDTVPVTNSELNWSGMVRPSLPSPCCQERPFFGVEEFTTNEDPSMADQMCCPPGVATVDRRAHPSSRRRGAARTGGCAQPSTLASPHLVTTLMLCNLPCKLTQEALARAVDDLGFGGTYDLIYIPLGRNNQIGYGFINFCTAEAAMRFSGVITSYSFSTTKTTKQVRVAAAKNQGFHRNLDVATKGDNFRRRGHGPLICGPASERR